METKDKKFQLRIKEHERDALKKVAETKGLSAAEYLLRYIRRDAKRLNLWPADNGD